MIFDMISVKVCWEQWCRWNCDRRVINAWKQAFSVVPKASPWCWKSSAPMHTTSLWGLAATWLVATGLLTWKKFQFESPRMKFRCYCQLPLFISSLLFPLFRALLGAWHFSLCVYSSFHNRLVLIREPAFYWVFYFIFTIYPCLFHDM